MSLGTTLLTQIFDVFIANNSEEKIYRRLYCESGQAANKSRMFVKDTTREKLIEIIPKCKTCTRKKLATYTIVIVFNELSRLGELEMLKKAYMQIGGPSNRAYDKCHVLTQKAIQRLGLIEAETPKVR